MAQYYSIDDIKARIIARGSKASKINWLVNEAGFNKADAENTYKLLISVCDRPRTISNRPIRFTMGVELECTNVNISGVINACRTRNINISGDGRGYYHSNGNDGFEVKHDGSLESSAGDTYGTAEIVSPILHNLDSLKSLCGVLNEGGVTVNKTCGCHVHLGASQFTDAMWYRIVCNYARLEALIDSFMPKSRRGDENTYCRSIVAKAHVVEGRPNISFEEMRRYFGSRYYKVNLQAYATHKTIEFRQHGGTTSFTKIENWVNFVAGLCAWSMRHEELISATSIDEIPFLNAEQKAFFKNRAEALA